MAHHKRRRHKNARSGCLMCKSHKMNGAKTWEFSRGFGKLRAELNARADHGEVAHVMYDRYAEPRLARAEAAFESDSTS